MKASMREREVSREGGKGGKWKEESKIKVVHLGAGQTFLNQATNFLASERSSERPCDLLCPRTVHSQGRREAYSASFFVSQVSLFKPSLHHSTSRLCYPPLWEGSGTPIGSVKLLGQVLLASTGTMVGPLYTVVVAPTAAETWLYDCGNGLSHWQG